MLEEIYENQEMLHLTATVAVEDMHPVDFYLKREVIEFCKAQMAKYGWVCVNDSEFKRITGLAFDLYPGTGGNFVAVQDYSLVGIRVNWQTSTLFTFALGHENSEKGTICRCETPLQRESMKQSFNDPSYCFDLPEFEGFCGESIFIETSMVF